MSPGKVLIFTASDTLVREIQECIPKELAELFHALPNNFEWEKDKLAILPMLVFIDATHGLTKDLTSLLNQLARYPVYKVLILDESQQLDTAPAVDDFLLVPLREVEVRSHVKYAITLFHLGQLTQSNTSLKALIDKLDNDIKTTQLIHSHLIPKKFPFIKGLKVTHKYLSGLKSGGDYLDFFEFADKAHVGILMSTSSGYGVSAAFMSVILRIAMKLSTEEVLSPAKTVSRIFDELKLTMKPEEHFSIFYGILNYKTFELVYTEAGSIQCFCQMPPDLTLSKTAMVTAALTKEGELKLKDYKKILQPGERLVLLSEGFKEVLPRAAISSFEAADFISELTFQVKSKFSSKEDMPQQDCSAMVIDVEKRAIRLAQ